MNMRITAEDLRKLPSDEVADVLSSLSPEQAGAGAESKLDPGWVHCEEALQVHRQHML